MIVAVTAGMALLSLLGLSIGLLGIAYPTVLVGSLAVVTMLLRRTIVEVTRSAGARLGRVGRLSMPGSVIAGVLGAVLVAQWLGCLGPEVGPDAIGSRMALPAIWLRNHMISARPEIEGSFMGLGGESLFLLVLPAAGLSAARMVAFACIIAAVCVIVGRPRRASNAWILATAVVFAGSTVVWLQALWGFCDMVQALLMLGSAEALRRWLQREDPRFAWTASFLAGAATAVKLNGVLAAGAVAVVVLAACIWRRRGVGRTVASTLGASFPAALVLAPSMIRSMLLTGNPVFPFANGIFKSPLAPLSLAARHFGVPLDSNAWRMAYQIFLEPGKFMEISGYQPLFLPLLLGCACAGFAASRTVRYWLAAFLASAAYWAATEQNLRYSLFVGLFAALVIARTAAALDTRRIVSGWMVPSCAIALAVSIGTTLELARPAFWLSKGNECAIMPLRRAVGLETADQYLRRNHPMYALAQIINKEMGGRTRTWQMPWLRDHLYFNGQILSMPHGDIRILDALVPLLPDRGPDLSPARIAGSLRGMGVTHLILDTTSPFTEGDPESRWAKVYSPGFTGTWLDLIGANMGLRLYRLRENPRPIQGHPRSLGSMSLSAGVRDFAVTPGRLYEIEISPLPGDIGSPDYITCGWHDKASKWLLFWNYDYPRRSSRRLAPSVPDRPSGGDRAHRHPARP